MRFSLICTAVLALLAGKAWGQDSPVVMRSGLVYESLRSGTGMPPRASDTVKVHYRGTLAGGKEFDSSYRRGIPAEFELGRVIPCWREGLQLMKPGGKARLTCPPALAYGADGVGDVVPPNATLSFEVELLGIKPR